MYYSIAQINNIIIHKTVVGTIVLLYLLRISYKLQMKFVPQNILSVWKEYF